MAKVSPLVLIPPLAFAALAGLFAGGMLTGAGQQELPSALVGQVAPGLPSDAIPGYPTLDPAVLTDERPKLVNFFASWCAPCRLEHPVLVDLAAEGIPIYGIAARDEPARSAAFLDELGNPYAAVGADLQNRLGVDWGTYGVPETFVLAGDGTIIDRLPFPLTPELVDSRLRPALARAERTE